MHGEDQPHQAEIMIAVKVADEDVTDPVKVGLKAHELHLCTFSAVDHKMSVLDLDELSGWITSVSWKCTTGTEYRNLKTHTRYAIFDVGYWMLG